MEEISRSERIQNQIAEAFNDLSSKEADELYTFIVNESLDKGFTYQRAGGRIEAINLMLVPSFFTGEQTAYLKEVSLSIKRGIETVFRAWFKDDDVAGMLPLDEEEGGWIRTLRKKPAPDSEPMWFRLDSHLQMKKAGWKDNITFFEINSCAVGGIHYSPVADLLFLEAILPSLKGHLHELPAIRKGPDLRDLLLGLISGHAKAIGRKTLNIVFAEDMTLNEGITEGPYIVDYLKGKDVNITLADPRELYVKDDEVFIRETMVDIVYRNFELKDIMAMEKSGDDVSGIKLAFFNNQVVSSLCGEFDHKSMWEALTSERLERYFSVEESALFRKHLLWTRVLRECNTPGPSGLKVDLIPFAARNKDSLVLKPNRQYGGYGVTIGRDVSPGEWESMLDAALKEEAGWVLQEYGAPEEYVFPLFEDGTLRFEKHNIVYGLSATVEGAGILGRVSREGVVNVARRGGLMPVLRI
jgi:hypothetical protein